MAQFRAVIQGHRGQASRLGHKRSGIWADINGWDLGIRVQGGFDPLKGDFFEVYLTGGSHRRYIPTLIGVFTASDLEAFQRGERRFGLVEIQKAVG